MDMTINKSLLSLNDIIAKKPMPPVSLYMYRMACAVIHALGCFQPDRIVSETLEGNPPRRTLFFEFKNSYGSYLIMSFHNQKEPRFESVSSNIKTVVQRDLLDMSKIQNIVKVFYDGGYQQLYFNPNAEHLVIAYE